MFELYLLVACILIGITGLLLPAARARSIVGAFPPWAQTGWYAGIALSGLLASAGVLRGDLLGSLIERGAMIILAGMCASFGVASIAYAGPSAVTGSLMLFGFAVPCIVRAKQITNDLSAVRTEIRAQAIALGHGEDIEP